jgi:phage FluMu protein Com
MQISHKQVDSDQNKRSDRPKIEDGEVTKIKCSNCNKRILDIKNIGTNDNIESYIIVKCPFCADKSFTQHILGRFAFVEPDGIKMTDFPMTTDKSPDGKIIQRVTVTTKGIK